MLNFKQSRKEILESAEKVLNKAHEIDCSLAVNFMAELQRMCDEVGSCQSCRMSNEFDYTTCACSEYRLTHPQKAVEIVQAWSDTHPKEKVVRS